MGDCPQLLTPSSLPTPFSFPTAQANSNYPSSPMVASPYTNTPSPCANTPQSYPATANACSYPQSQQALAALQQQLLLQQYLTFASPLVQQQLLLQQALLSQQWASHFGANQAMSNSPFVFKAHSLQPRTTNTEAAVTREQRLQAYRKKRSKRTQRPVDRDKSMLAQARPRDENGQFLPGKLAKPTELLELKSKLNCSEVECNKLRNSLSERDKELETIRLRMLDLKRQNDEQQERLQIMENRQHRYDIHTIREFKQRLQYLQQLEMAVHDRMSRCTEVQQDGSGQTVSSESNQPCSPSYNEIESPTLSDMPISPDSNTENEKEQYINNSDRKPVPKKTIDVGAYYVYDPSWKEHTIAPPFREKIDFSKISLKPYGPPPNFVEQARTEYFEAQKQWERQQLEVNNHNQNHILSSLENYLYSNSPCTHAFTEKIDLKDKISRLRKTPLSPYLFPQGQASLLSDSVHTSADSSSNVFDEDDAMANDLTLEQLLGNDYDTQQSTDMSN